MFEEVERPRRLVFTSAMKMPDGSTVHSHVRVTFEPEHGKTRIRIVRSGFPSAQQRDAFESGWGSILEGLDRAVDARVAFRRTS